MKLYWICVAEASWVTSSQGRSPFCPGIMWCGLRCWEISYGVLGLRTLNLVTELPLYLVNMYIFPSVSQDTLDFSQQVMPFNPLLEIDLVSGSVVKNLPANAGDTRDIGLIPDLGRSLGIGNSNTLQYSCLENFMDRGAWGLHSLGLERVRHDWASAWAQARTYTHTHTHTHSHTHLVS